MTQANTAATPTTNVNVIGTRSGFSGAFRLVLILAASIGIGLMIWFLPFGREIVSDTDKRNQRDLAIAASGLESWSETVNTIARTNFIRGRVSALEDGDSDSADGWTHRARFRHPVLGDYKVLYSVGSPAVCDAIAQKVKLRDGTLPFLHSGFLGSTNSVKVLGRFGVANILRQDTQPLPRNSVVSASAPIDAAAYVADILGDAAPVGDASQVCYGAVVQLDRLVIIDHAARAFSNLLVVDGQRRIVAQVGAEPIPLQSIDRLTADGSVLVDTLAASVGRQSDDKDRKTTPLIDSLDPVDVNIAGKAMRAYVRPFQPLLTGFPACALPVAAPPAAAAPPATAAAGSPPAAAAAPPVAVSPPASATGQCYVVGLMPKAPVWRQIAHPPLTLVFGLGLAIGVALTFMPALRLLLLGPREAIGKLEAIGVALGIPAAASLAILAVLFSADVISHRNTADARARSIAVAAAGDGAGHLARALVQARAMAATAAGAGPAALDAGKLSQFENGARAALATQAAKPVPANYAQACIDGYLQRARSTLGQISVGLDLPVNPRPLRCSEAPICQGANQSPNHPVLVESIGLYTPRGFAVPGTRTIACRSFFGGRSQLAGRDYFQRIISNDASRGDGGAPLYTVEQVLSQPDGLNKTVITFKSNWIPPGYVPGDPQERAAYVVASTVITDLLTPAVLPPFQIMVVDTRNASLPVIMHPAPNRAHAELLTTMLDDPDPVREQLRDLVLDGGTTSFSRFYDGSESRFVAAPIKGTRWVVLVHYAIADIDAVPARTARYALADWAAMSVLFCTGWALWLWVVGKHGWADEDRLHRIGPLRPLFERGWPRLWPQEPRRADYRWIRRRLLAGGLVGIVVLAAIDMGGWATISALLLGITVRAAAGVLLHWRLGEDRKAKPGRGHRALRPETQSAFIRVAYTLILCVSAVPMLAFWNDGHRLGGLEQRRDLLLAIDGGEGVVERADRGLEGIFWTFGRAAGAGHNLAKAYGFQRGADAHANQKPDDTGPTQAPESTFVDALLHITDTNIGRIAVPDCPSGDQPRLCGPEGAARGISLPSPGLAAISLADAVFLLLLGGTLLVGLRWIMLRVLRALCGFGIALEAVEYPQLDLTTLWVAPDPTAASDPSIQTLNRKSLLVNAPWSIKPMLNVLRENGEAKYGIVRSIVEFDLSGLQVKEGAGLPRLRVQPGQIILITGLDLVLADAARRLLALAALEEVVKQVDALDSSNQDGEGGETRDPYLLFLAPSAPMDRILDAYEREQPDAMNPDAKRENLRWARVFENFATFPFLPIELTRGTLPDSLDMEKRNAHEIKAVRTVFEELRWLSPQVVNGCINDERYPSRRLLALGLLPVRDPALGDESPFIPLYEDIIGQWAKARHFPGRNAALTYIRGQFIEHYQRLWSASTVAERLVLHHLAFGRFVNIGTSLGFAPLVRRGLVVLDPEPRVMNESFAMFIRQAEKLDRIRDLQLSLPESAWLKSRLSIFLVLGLAILALAAMAMLAGQQLTALLPVLAAGAPALIATAQRLMRPS